MCPLSLNRQIIDSTSKDLHLQRDTKHIKKWISIQKNNLLNIPKNIIKRLEKFRKLIDTMKASKQLKMLKNDCSLRIWMMQFSSGVLYAVEIIPSWKWGSGFLPPES